MPHKETIQKIKRALGGGEYGERQNKRISSEMMKKIEHIQEMPKRAMRKVMSTGGYLLKKIKN